MQYKCHKTNLKRSGSNINFPDLIKSKNARINLFNDDDKCFWYTEAGDLNHGQVRRKFPRNIKIKTVMNEFDITTKEQVSHQEKITGKTLKGIIQQLFFMCYLLKNEIYPAHITKLKLRWWKKYLSQCFEKEKVDIILHYLHDH